LFEKLLLEKLLARQQLRTKNINSNSWFIEIKKMLIKYNLQDPEYYLDNPMTKRLWITSIKREIQNYYDEGIYPESAVRSGFGYLIALCSPTISVPEFQFLLCIVDISHLRQRG
jgi:hypothetical protein